VGRAVGEAGVPLLVFGSSLHVYGNELSGKIGPSTPFGHPTDLAHLSKIYGEVALALKSRRFAFDLAILRLGIVYGRAGRAFRGGIANRRRQVPAARRAGEELPLDDGGRATIGSSTSPMRRESFWMRGRASRTSRPRA